MKALLKRAGGRCVARTGLAIDRLRGWLMATRLVQGGIDRLIARAQLTPYEHLPGYMERYWLIEPSRWTFGCGLRLHRILRSDHDRDLHTHPWWNVSVILRGGYWECMPGRVGEVDVLVGGYANLREPFRIAQRKPGHVILRSRHSRHKLMLFRGPAVTLMLTGPDNGHGWGYHIPGIGLIDRRVYSRVVEDEIDAPVPDGWIE